MANLEPIKDWSEVPQLEVSTPAKAGPGGPMNAQAQALLNRTEFLKDAIDHLVGGSSKFYPTLAQANADIANIAVNTTVTTGDNGIYYKESATSTTLTKSPYDPVQISKDYTISLFSVREAPVSVNIKITGTVDTNTNTPTIFGTGQSGRTVEIKYGDMTATTVVDSNGNWSYTFSNLQETTYLITVKHTDSTGMTSTDSISITINTRQGLFDRNKTVNSTWVSQTGELSRTTDPNNQWYNSQSFILPAELGKTYFFYFGSQNLNSPNNLALHGFDRIEDAVFSGNTIIPVVAGRITLTTVAGKTGWYQYTVPTTPETIKSIVQTVKFTTMDLTSTLRIYKDALPQDA